MTVSQENLTGGQENSLSLSGTVRDKMREKTKTNLKNSMVEQFND